MLLVFKSHNHFLNYFQDFLSKSIKCNFNWEMHFQLKKKKERKILILIMMKSSIWAFKRTYLFIFLLLTKWFPKSDITDFSSLRRHFLFVSSLYLKRNKTKTPKKILSQGMVSLQRTHTGSFLRILPLWGSTGDRRILLNGRFWWCPQIRFLGKEFVKKLLTNRCTVSRDHVSGWFRMDTNSINKTEISTAEVVWVSLAECIRNNYEWLTVLRLPLMSGCALGWRERFPHDRWTNKTNCLPFGALGNKEPSEQKSAPRLTGELKTPEGLCFKWERRAQKTS